LPDSAAGTGARRLSEPKKERDRVFRIGLAATHLARRVRLLAVLLLVLPATVAVVSPSAAHAAGCQTWMTASWGKAWLCVDYNSDNLSYRVRGQLVDTVTDGKCVSLYAQEGDGPQFEVETYHWVTACNTNQVVSYSFTARNPGNWCGARLVRGTSASWDRFLTLWNNPYKWCISWGD
jgi:hypothetical protein